MGDYQERIALLVDLAIALHYYGTPAHRLEELMTQCAVSLEVEVQFFSTPTAIFFSFGPAVDCQTILRRVEPGDVNLGKLLEVQRILRQVIEGTLHAATACETIEAIRAAPPRWGSWTIALAFAMTTGCAALIFGGGWREAGVTAALGFLIDRLSRLLGRIPSADSVFQPLAAFLAAFLASAASRALGGLAVDTVILASLIVLVPGLTLTISLRELASRHLASGTTRLMGALLQFLAIGFGAAIGSRAAALIPGVPHTVDALAIAPWAFWGALALAPFCLAFLFQAPLREHPWIAMAALIAYLGSQGSSHVFGPELAAFFGALLLGLLGNAYSALTQRPSSVLIVPGLLLLVPGSLGFRSFVALMADDVPQGIHTAFAVTVVAISLVAGILFADILVRRRQ